MRACICGLWVISLLTVGVESFYIPRSIVGKPGYRSRSLQYENKAMLLVRRPFSQSNADAMGALTSHSSMGHDTEPLPSQDLALAQVEGDVDDQLSLHLKGLPPVLPSEEMLGVVEIAVQSITKKQVAKWMWCLSKLGVTASNPAQKQLLLQSMNTLSDKECLTYQDTLMLLTSLSRTGIVQADLPQNVVLSLMRSVAQHIWLLPCGDLASILNALIQLGFTWASLPVATQASLLSSFEPSRMPLRMNAKPATRTLRALAGLKVHARHFTDAQLQALFYMMVFGSKVDKPMYAHRDWDHAAMALVAANAMGVHCDNIPNDLLKQIESNLVDRIVPGDGHTLVSAITTLVELNWRPSPVLYAAIYNTIASRASTFTSQFTHQVLRALAKLKVEWTALPSTLTFNIENNLLSLLTSEQFFSQHDASQHMSNTIHSLGRMDAKFNSFAPGLQHAMQSAFVNLHKNLTSQGLSNSIYGLGKMRAEWSSFSDEFRSCVLETFSNVQHKLNAQEFSCFIKGLGIVGAKFQQLPPSFGVSVEQCMKQLTERRLLVGRDVAMILGGLVAMDATWESLHLNIITVISQALLGTAPHFASREVANIMFELTFLSLECVLQAPSRTGDAPLAPVSVSVDEAKSQLVWKMMTALVERFHSIDPEERSVQTNSQVSLFFALLSVLPGGEQLLPKIVPRYIDPAKVIGTVRWIVCNDLQLALGQDYNVSNWFDGLQNDFLQADLTIHHKNGTLAAFVELDSPFDFRFVNGSAVRKPQDLLKQFCYAHHYPSVPFYRVRDVTKFNLNETTAILAQQLLAPLDVHHGGGIQEVEEKEEEVLKGVPEEAAYDGKNEHMLPSIFQV